MNKLKIPPAVNWFEANVVTCAADNTLVYGSMGDIVVIYPNNRDEAANIKIISNAHERVLAVSTNPDWNEESKLLVSIGEEKIVRLWNINAFEMINSHNIHKLDKKSSSKVVGVCFANDNRIISVSSEGVIVLWRPSFNETVTFSNIITLDKSHVTCMSICPHATWLAAFGISKGIVVITDLRKSGKVLYNLRCYDSSPIISLSWCPTPFNIFPEIKRVILTPKARLEKNVAENKNDEEKENILTESLPKNIENVKSNDEIIVEDDLIKINDSVLNDSSKSDTIILEEPSVIIEDTKNLEITSRKPSSTVFTKESREQILHELANLSLNQPDKVEIADTVEVSSSKPALESKNVKENPWINLKHADDDELNNSQENIDPRASLLSDKRVVDEFDFLNECTALKYRILGERNVEESEDAESEEVFHESMAIVEDNDKDITLKDNIEAESCQTNIVKEESANKETVINTEPIKKEFLLASSSKSGPICIWRAGTDGRMQLELQPAIPKRRDNRRDNKRSQEKTWITVFWAKPDILLSSAPKGELLLWDLLKYTGNGRKHQPLVVNFDHRNLLFTICGRRIISNPLTETSVKQEDLTVWTTGQDKQIFETVLNKERTCISSYLALSVVQCLNVSPIDSNRIAMGLSDGSIIIWNLSMPHTRCIAMNRFYHKNNGKIACLAWHPLTENIIGYASLEGKVATLNTSAHVANTFLSSFFNNPVHKVEWGPLKGESDKYALYVCGEGKLVYYDVDNIKTAPVPIHLEDEYITHMSWKPDYSVLAIGTKSNAIMLLSPTFEILSSMFVAQKTITNMLWHPMATLNSTADVSKCCNWLAIGTRAGQCAVYNMICEEDATEVSSLVQELKGHSMQIRSISWSSFDDGRLITSSDDCTAQIWNVETGTVISSYIANTLEPIANVLWSPLKEDLIISTAKDVLEIWDLKEHEPKTMEEIRDSFKTLLKLKNKYQYKPQIEKSTVQAQQVDNESAEKTKKKVLLPTLSKEQNDVVQALSDCRQLMSESISEKNSVMQFFGKKDDVLELLTKQQRDHMKRNKPELAQHLSLWKGDLSETIKTAIENGSVTPWLICMTPMVSPQLWQSACRSYAIKQSEDSSNSDPTVTASFFLACHDIPSAVNVLIEAKLFREAIIVIKSRLVEDSDIYNSSMTDVMEKWAINSIITGLFEIAAQCYIYLGKYDEAAKALFKRSDVKSLQMAMELANKGQIDDLKLAIQTRLDMFERIEEPEAVTSAKIVEVAKEIVEAEQESPDEPKMDELEVKLLRQTIETYKKVYGVVSELRSELKDLKLQVDLSRQEVAEEIESEGEVIDVEKDMEEGLEKNQKEEK